MHIECRHIMPNGKKCRAAALRNMPYCYFHTRVHELTRSKSKPKNQPLELPVLEDRSAIQLALAQILDALATARIDHKRAGLLLYGLQIASQNISGSASILSDETVQSLTRTRDGRELAPEKLTCDHPEDCKECKGRERCITYRTAAALRGGSGPYDEPDEEKANEDSDNGG